jgi:hypothetical protein
MLVGVVDVDRSDPPTGSPKAREGIEHLEVQR